ncbi:nucleoside 2-deoxyribosyltransferase domain-containing protein [Saccharothrix sp. HUAS TT10]
MAREPVPLRGPSVFLAGPTPEAGGPPSWRPAAFDVLAARWSDPRELVVVSPESRDGLRASSYEEHVDWEIDSRASVAAIMFWIPRDMRTLPGLTTNTEFGMDVDTGRAVLGVPPDCPNPERNRYLAHVARRHGVPVRYTLEDTVAAALGLAAATGPAPTVRTRG